MSGGFSGEIMLEWWHDEEVFGVFWGNSYSMDGPFSIKSDKCFCGEGSM